MHAPVQTNHPQPITYDFQALAQGTACGVWVEDELPDSDINEDGFRTVNLTRGSRFLMDSSCPYA